jgi:DNA polymerase III subunit epsilon
VVTQSSRHRAAHWASQVLGRADAVFLDTETTGLDAAAEIVDIAVLDRDGAVLLAQLVRPRRPIPPSATAIHGIDDSLVRDAPGWADVYPSVKAILARYPCVVVYNAPFDRRILEQVCDRHCLPPLHAEWHCAMQRYAEFAGEWHPKYANYRWHRLEAALAAIGRAAPRDAHRARADAESCRLVVRAMAVSLEGAGAAAPVLSTREMPAPRLERGARQGLWRGHGRR